MSSAEQDVLARLVQAIAELEQGAREAMELMGPVPGRPEALEKLSAVERTAARAMLKAVEQQQDVISRTLRVILVLEEEDIAGLSGRDIADKAEALGIIGDGDEWSALVRLRNRLAHEYPLGRDVQLARLNDAAEAVTSLATISASVVSYARQKGHLP